MNPAVIFLGAWSGVSLCWWGIAIKLVHAARRRRSPGADARPRTESLTVFKPLPPVDDAATVQRLAGAIRTFLQQLGPGDDLRLGVPEAQATLWLPTLDQWRREFPSVPVHAVVRPPPDQRANPKVAWLEHLAPGSRATLWLWSDADILAPPGFLQQLRDELADAPAIGAVTAPYRVGEARGGAGWLDALFVNMEFLPGTLLLGRLGTVSLAFGAAVLFRAGDFHRRISWDALGASLADDHELGRRLAPVRVSGALASTLALETRLGPALRHLHRWQRTIRWCRPSGAAALVVILPLSGWLLRCAAAPGDHLSWIGLAGQYAAELLVAALLLHGAGFRGPCSGLPALLAWPAVRLGVWLASWLPIPVHWSAPGDPWTRPRKARRPEAG
ncbi:MAG: hypothetical protein J0L84_00540 [Verrucomicrobia bacterium]|nr:hypothetical protein [Verrucomicrobiota bacterium]